MQDCPGCEQELLYPHQHATMCPVFAHASVKRHADFIECSCGQLCVSYVDHFEHLQDVWRKRRSELSRLT